MRRRNPEKLSEKTMAKTEQAGNFLTDVADVFLFMMTDFQRNIFARL